METAADAGRLGGRWSHPRWLQAWTSMEMGPEQSSNLPTTFPVPRGPLRRQKQRPLSPPEATMRREGTHKPAASHVTPSFLWPDSGREESGLGRSHRGDPRPLQRTGLGPVKAEGAGEGDSSAEIQTDFVHPSPLCPAPPLGLV